MVDVINGMANESVEAMLGVCVVMFVTLYIFTKTLLWWILFGTGKLLFKVITPSEWFNKTLRGLGLGLGLIVLNVILWLTYSPDSLFYIIPLVILLFFAFRVVWREFFTLFGLLRGDWHPLHPELQFFAWETFNIWLIFKPLEWLFRFFLAWISSIFEIYPDWLREADERRMKQYSDEKDQDMINKQNGYY